MLGYLTLDTDLRGSWGVCGFCVGTVNRRWTPQQGSMLSLPAPCSLLLMVYIKVLGSTFSLGASDNKLPASNKIEVVRTSASRQFPGLSLNFLQGKGRRARFVQQSGWWWAALRILLPTRCSQNRERAEVGCEDPHLQFIAGKSQSDES